MRGRHLPAYAAEKSCTVAILGLATPESLQLRWGQLSVNLYTNLKSIFMTLSLSLSDLYGNNPIDHPDSLLS